MKSFQTCLKVFLAFSLLSFISISDLLAKKPDNPRPPKDDPCLVLQEFTPDFAFYRDTGRGKSPTFTFFVGDTENGCEKELFEFSRMDQMVYALTYSATREPNGDYLGRLVWRIKFHPTDVLSIWSYDFRIVGTEVEYISGPDLVMDNEYNTDRRITNIDLSPDLMTLVYNMYTRDADGVGDDSIRMVDVDTCVDSGCSFDSDLSLVLAEPNEPEGESIESPTWGSLGERVYYRRSSRNEPEWLKLQYVELPEGWKDAWPEPTTFDPSDYTYTLASTLDQSGFPPHIREIASGIVYDGENPNEILAVQVPQESGCGYISFIDVAACGNPCAVEPKFVGINASWTRQGEVIHNFTRETAKLCNNWGGTVGLFDGTDVSTVLKGFMPDAAGGIPWE